LKNGPSVWRIVGASPSSQAGVGESSCAKLGAAPASGQPAASETVVNRKLRRVPRVSIRAMA
jgi:hypothetical protein